MRKATEVRIDLQVRAAYIRYRSRGPSGTSVRLSEDVVVHYDAQNNVVGIELIELRRDAIRAAEAFAVQNDLGFPLVDQYVHHGGG